MKVGILFVCIIVAAVAATRTRRGKELAIGEILGKVDRFPDNSISLGEIKRALEWLKNVYCNHIEQSENDIIALDLLSSQPVVEFMQGCPLAQALIPPRCDPIGQIQMANLGELIANQLTDDGGLLIPAEGCTEDSACALKINALCNIVLVS